MPTKCSNHSNTDAIGQCTQCKIPLCETCNVSEDDDLVMCEACAMLSTFSAMSKRKKGIDEKRTNKELQKTGKKIKRRSVTLAALLIAASVIVIVELLWYFNLTNMEKVDFDPYENYLASTIEINDAIIRYREDHKGEVPDSLQDLIGRYLPETDIWKKGIKVFYYSKNAPSKYELMPPLESDDIPDIVFSEEGPEIVGM